MGNMPMPPKYTRLQSDHAPAVLCVLAALREDSHSDRVRPRHDAADTKETASLSLLQTPPHSSQSRVAPRVQRLQSRWASAGLLNERLHPFLAPQIRPHARNVPIPLPWAKLYHGRPRQMVGKPRGGIAPQKTFGSSWRSLLKFVINYVLSFVFLSTE
jgi:hypothetical protein